MSRDTFDRLRLPIALGVALMLLAGYLFLRRAEADSTALDPSSSIVVGEPGGGVLTPPPSPTLAPTPPPAPSTPSPTAEATPVPTPVPQEEEFIAEVMACESITEDAECNDEIRRLGGNDDTFVALVIFDNASAGDVMNAVLDGPSGPLEGGAFALQGSGRGFYYSTFAVEGLPNGQYTLTAIRNGEPVARTELRKGGGGGNDDDDDD